MSKSWRLSVFAAFLLVFLVAAIYHGLVVKTYLITADQISPGESVRIVLISDLHSHIYGENQSQLISLIKKQEPDIIALTGDIADDQVAILGSELLLAGIQGMAPVYYVTGNHEIWSEDTQNIKNTFSKYGVRVLEHQYERVKVGNSHIIIAGVDDPDIVGYERTDFNWEQELYEAFAPLSDAPELKVLLSHRPELIDIYKKTSFDLVLSGHAHGGQLRIPLVLNGLYAPNQGWFPPYAGGKYFHDNMIHIVSRGVSYNPRLPRIFNPPEIVVVDLKGK